MRKNLVRLKHWCIALRRQRRHSWSGKKGLRSGDASVPFRRNCVYLVVPSI